MKTETSFSQYKTQRNLVTKLNEKEKKTFFGKIEAGNKNGNKSLWSICKPFLSSSSKNIGDKISLIEENVIISEDLKITNILNTYFVNITAGLNIPKWNSTVSDLSDDPVINAIRKYASHPSIIKIKENRKSDVKFDFSHVLPEETYNTKNKLRYS